MATLYHIYQKIVKSTKKSREEESAKILQAAKEADSTVKAELESKIEALSAQFVNLKTNIDKDIDYLKESHAMELKNIGQRIEILRDELRNQNASLVNLLSKLIDK
jgi:hypothetical protein